MEGDGSSVTLIFYRVGEQWWKESFLNILAAAAQMSSLTHVEIAIGGTIRNFEHPPPPAAHTHTHTQQSQTAYFTKRNRSRVAEEAGANGMMKNVCRVFNDKVGVVSIII